MIWTQKAALAAIGIATAIGLGGRFIADDPKAGFNAILNHLDKVEETGSSLRLLRAQDEAIEAATQILENMTVGKAPKRSSCEAYGEATRDYREQAERFNKAFNSRAERGGVTPQERANVKGLKPDLLVPYEGNFALAEKICNRAVFRGYSPS